MRKEGSASVVSARYLTAPRHTSIMFPPPIEGREKARGRQEEGKKTGRQEGERVKKKTFGSYLRPSKAKQKAKRSMQKGEGLKWDVGWGKRNMDRWPG